MGARKGRRRGLCILFRKASNDLFDTALQQRPKALNDLFGTALQQRPKVSNDLFDTAL